MKKILVTFAITVATVAFAAPTQAAPKTVTPHKIPAPAVKVHVGPTAIVKVAPRVHSATPHVTTTIRTGSAAVKISVGTGPRIQNYHLQHGTRFQHGYYYRGHSHNHWGLVRFDPRYGCDCFWDPYVLAWFYWCERDICYYPVSYVPYRTYVFPQVVVGPQSTLPVAVMPQPVSECLPLPAGTSSDVPAISDILPIPEPVLP